MIGSTPTVPILIALVAGGLAVVNPCGFPLLPAFLSFYLGADERRLPSAPTRVLQGPLVGALVTVGFLGFFRPWSACRLATASARSHAPFPRPGSRRAPGSHSPAYSPCPARTSACQWAPATAKRRHRHRAPRAAAVAGTVRPFGRPVRLDTTSVA